MTDSAEQTWPDGIPTSLWRFDLLGAERHASLPFMGIHPDWNFHMAFIFGALMVAAFAWQRFKQRSFEPTELDYEVVKRLSPLQLRDGKAMRAAYIYYAGIMLSIYAALTFFGGLILKAINYIPMAGIQADVDQSAMTSPTWPLYLALGMAGFAPMLKPVEVVETWLRRKVHGWAGVPVQLKDRTRRFLLALDRKIQPGVDEAIGKGSSIAQPTAVQSRVFKKLSEIPAWMKDGLERMGNYGPLVRKRIELELMIEAVRDPGSWPETHILDELQPLVREQRLSAEKALLAMDDLAKMLDPIQRSSGDGPVESSVDTDAHARQRRQVEALLAGIVGKVDRSRLELAAILTVYAERSPYFEPRFNSNVTDRVGRHILEETLKSAVDELAARQKPETEFWTTTLLFPVFGFYAIMTLLGFHSLLGTLQLTTSTVLATATVETLQVAVIFWLPAVAVLALRTHLAEADQLRRPGNSRPSSESAERMVYYVATGGIVAAIGLGLLSTLWTALVAENTERFRDLMAGSPQSVLVYMLPKSLCTCIFIFLLVRALDGPKKKRPVALLYALVSATVVMAALFAITVSVSASCTFQPSCSWLDSLGKGIQQGIKVGFKDVYRIYNLSDFIVCFTAVFVAIINAVWPPKQSLVVTSNNIPKAAAVAILAIVIAANFATGSGIALAEESPGTRQSYMKVPDQKTPVRVGFRKDAEPFSYKAGPLSARHYRGYVADLCYSIFADSIYQVEEVPVTAEDRFDSFRMDRKPATAKVDMLCDPTTLRFWRDANDVEIDGFFSPIVFVSGVSYLNRPAKQVRLGVDLAYVRGSTAKKVAFKACEIDLFRAVDPRTTPACEASRTDCAGNPNADDSKIRLCEFDDHDQAIDWLCAPSDRQAVYFGDREIIQAKLESWRSAGRCKVAEVEKQASFYTYEPYALLVAPSQQGLAQFVQRRVYDFFSHSPRAVGLFSSYFPNVQMSPMMANLFLLNAVDNPMYDTVPSYLFEAEKRK
ncbi:hypothetical protein [Rhizobium leguminosarum]|uniref:hypothetical protein n=1 Tax=Rhizobium leguminosarum TaxID=384 RepID=UPI001F386756|nr:hypothetical protein [Rhizobium leguminosarum]UIJ84286.1 hypothetical protein LZK78_37135 [Rhizobium leguminosarum]